MEICIRVHIYIHYIKEASGAEGARLQAYPLRVLGAVAGGWLAVVSPARREHTGLLSLWISHEPEGPCMWTCTKPGGLMCTSLRSSVSECLQVSALTPISPSTWTCHCSAS